MMISFGCLVILLALFAALPVYADKLSRLTPGAAPGAKAKITR